MPIDKNDLDRIEERETLLDKMEEGKFYSIAEMSELILGRKLPESKKEVYDRITGGGEPKIEIVLSGLFNLTLDITYVNSILAIRLIRGDIVEGSKNGVRYYGKK